MIRIPTILLASSALALLTITTNAQTPREPSDSQYVAPIRPLLQLKSSDFREVVDRYSTDRAAMMRRFDAAYSPVRREQLRGFYTGWRSALQTTDFNTLSQPARVDYVLLDTQLQYEL